MLTRCLIEHGDGSKRCLGAYGWVPDRRMALVFNSRAEAEIWLVESKKKTPAFIGEMKHHIVEAPPATGQMPAPKRIVDYDPLAEVAR